MQVRMAEKLKIALPKLRLLRYPVDLLPVESYLSTT
jgi:hypothetical protein